MKLAITQQKSKMSYSQKVALFCGFFVLIAIVIVLIDDFYFMTQMVYFLRKI
jgi:hypothetical protein